MITDDKQTCSRLITSKFLSRNRIWIRDPIFQWPPLYLRNLIFQWLMMTWENNNWVKLDTKTIVPYIWTLLVPYGRLPSAPNNWTWQSVFLSPIFGINQLWILRKILRPALQKLQFFLYNFSIRILIRALILFHA